MTNKSNSQSPRQESRRKSLRYHSEQEKPEIPAYLKAVSASEEEAALSLSKDTAENMANKNAIAIHDPQRGITITMERTSFISVIFGCMLLGLCFFAMGFATSYVFFQPSSKPNVVAVKEKAPEPEPEPEDSEYIAPPANEGERLAQLAQNITGKLSDENAPGAGEVNAKVQETIAAKNAAAQLKEESEKALKELPINLRGKVKVQPQPDSIFEIDLGVISTLEQAKELSTELKKLDIDATVFETKNSNGLPIFRLRTGKFKTYEEAAKYMATLPKPYILWASVDKPEKVTN